MPSRSSSELRSLLGDPGILTAPAVYDCLTARLASQAGFRIAFTSGFGISASLLGTPDIGLLTAPEVIDRVRYICRTAAIPIIADIDTGYGGPLNVMRTVEEVIDAGAAGVILEDQQWPKRCGHLEGKRVIPADEYIRKLRAAIRARADSGLVVVARTDSRSTLGLQEALDRGRAYADAGADVIFVEAPQSLGELETIGRHFDGIPLLANIIEGGKTPALTAQQLEQLGYKLCAFALSGLFAATKAVQECFRHIVQHGTTGQLLDSFSFHQFSDVVSLRKYEELDAELSTD